MLYAPVSFQDIKLLLGLLVLRSQRVNGFFPRTGVEETLQGGQIYFQHLLHERLRPQGPTGRWRQPIGRLLLLVVDHLLDPLLLLLALLPLELAIVASAVVKHVGDHQGLEGDSAAALAQVYLEHNQGQKRQEHEL